MCDVSEIDELYDEFLDLDGNPFHDLNLDSRVTAQDLNETEFEVDTKWDLTTIHSNIRNNNNVRDSENYNLDINNINNNHINIKKVLGESDTESDLDLLNQNLVDSVGLYLDKNGKVRAGYLKAISMSLIEKLICSCYSNKIVYVFFRHNVKMITR